MTKKDFNDYYYAVTRYAYITGYEGNCNVLVDTMDRLTNDRESCYDSFSPLRDLTEVHYKVYIMSNDGDRMVESYWKGSYINEVVEKYGAERKVRVVKYGPDYRTRVTDSVA